MNDAGRPIRMIFFYAGYSMVVAGILIPILQVIYYLRSGRWFPITLLTGLKTVACNNFANWLAYPRSWFGIHEIISNLPLSLTLIAIGIVFIIFAIVLAINSLSE